MVASFFLEKFYTYKKIHSQIITASIVQSAV